jgi:hypothetical protein
MRTRTRCCLGFLVLAAATALVASWSGADAEPRGGGWVMPPAGGGGFPGGGGRPNPWDRPGDVWVEPNINIYTQPPVVAPGPETVPAALAACGDHGLIVDCLRSNYGSVSIRRLEACLGTEVLPANPVDVRSCLAAGNW